MQMEIVEEGAISGKRASITRAPAEAVDLLEHMGSVRHIARQIHRKLPSHIELEDLISAGTLGLMDACRRFDPNRHIQFKSFAQFRIRGAVLDWLRMLDWSPRELRRKSRSVQAAVHSLTQRLERAPSEHEIAAEMAVEISELRDLLRDLNALQVESLEDEPGAWSTSEDLDLIPISAGDDPLARAIQQEEQQRLADAMESLPERQRLVLTLYYYEELTLREIGAALGVVESRVSQIRSAAIARLRAAMGVPSFELTPISVLTRRSATQFNGEVREAA